MTVRTLLKPRFVLLGLYAVLSGGWYFVFLSSVDPLGISIGKGGPGDLIIAFIVGTLVLFGMQFLFLLGAPQLTWPRPRRKRSIFVSLAVGSLIALLLTAGIVLSLASLYKIVFDPTSFRGTGTTDSPQLSPNVEAMLPWALLAVALGAWVFWFLIFALLGTAAWTSRFTWIYRTLIAGTVIELLITIPIDVQVRKRTNCYCGEGTFFSLVIGLTAILWTFGPGVALLFIVRRNQLAARNTCCIQCGYDLRGIKSNRCPECGTPFKPTVKTADGESLSQGF